MQEKDQAPVPMAQREALRRDRIATLSCPAPENIGTSHALMRAILCEHISGRPLAAGDHGPKWQPCADIHKRSDDNERQHRTDLRYASVSLRASGPCRC